MPRGFRGWAIFLAVQAVLTFAIRLVIKLADNALMGWLDDQLAELLGIKSPEAATLLVWAPPFVLAGTILAIYHFLVSHNWHQTPSRFQDRTREIDLIEALLWVAETSAWGRWQKAKRRIGIRVVWVEERGRLRIASDHVRKAALSLAYDLIRRA